MTKKVLIFSEKPSICKHFEKPIIKTWSDAQVHFIAAMPVVNPVAQYPRGLTFNAYPLIATPCYKPGKMMFCSESPINKFEWSSFEDLNLAQYDEIVFACDPDYCGAICFYLSIEHYFGKNIWSTRNFPAIIFTSLTENDIEAAVQNRSNFIDSCRHWISYGLVKRYFDWHWNINSQVILSETLRRAGVFKANFEKTDSSTSPYSPSGNPVISKYGLQILYFIQDNPGLSEGRLIENMSKWVGTGKYPMSDTFGSAASRCSILGQLIQLGLISKSSNSRNPIYITEKGLRFITLLHKDMRDADLPSRLDAWCKDGLEISKPKIDRYIKTFFGKQKKIL